LDLFPFVFLKQNEVLKITKPAKARQFEESLAKFYLERLRKELFLLDEKK